MKYFTLAKELNQNYKERLLDINGHFRGNINSCSLISLDKNTPEIGMPGITRTNAAGILMNFNPQLPKRLTPEKSLQAAIIRYAIHNNNILPFGDALSFITSELAAKENGKKIVNDILAIDSNDNLVVIELKSIRSTKVIEQAVAFRDYVYNHTDFFEELITLLTNRNWNGNVRAIAVWPKGNQGTRIENKGVELIAYDNNYNFYPEKTE